MTANSTLIAAQIERLKADFNLHPVTATEIEFYLHGSEDESLLQKFWDEVLKNCENAGIVIHNKSKETGHEQHEIALAPWPDPIRTASDTESLKSIISDAASCHNMRADFSARPFEDRPGSGLHIHVHLNDAEGKNTFYKDDETISAALKYSIGGLLAWLPFSMPVFAPHEESYKRFTEKSNAPLTISWGANNRTVAIRLPDAAHDNKRIEHRVSGADADVSLVIAVILAAIHDGISNCADCGGQVYGDAALPMYNLPRLPTNLADARAAMESSSVLKHYFSVSDLLPAH